MYLPKSFSTGSEKDGSQKKSECKLESECDPEFFFPTRVDDVFVAHLSKRITQRN
jgi:hypothetical protein